MPVRLRQKKMPRAMKATRMATPLMVPPMMAPVRDPPPPPPPPPEPTEGATSAVVVDMGALDAVTLVEDDVMVVLMLELELLLELVLEILLWLLLELELELTVDTEAELESPLVGTTLLVGRPLVLVRPLVGRPLVGRRLVGRPLVGRRLVGRPLVGRPLGSSLLELPLGLGLRLEGATILRDTVGARPNVMELPGGSVDTGLEKGAATAVSGSWLVRPPGRDAAVATTVARSDAVPQPNCEKPPSNWFM